MVMHRSAENVGMRDQDNPRRYIGHARFVYV